MPSPKKAKQLQDGNLEMCAVKIKVGLKENGHAKYPDFNSDPQLVEIMGGIDWSHYIDQYGGSVFYDKKSGHKDHNPEDNSPLGMQWCMILVPEEFCKRACEVFSDVCTHVSSEEFENFYDNRSTHKMPEIDIDEKILRVIEVKQKAGIALNQRELNALDENHEEPGITKNKMKKWTNACKQKGIKIKEIKK